MNYETADDSFITTVDDIFSHASREKENSPISEDGEITPILIRRAVTEVFVKTPTLMHVNKKISSGLQRAKAEACQPAIIRRNEKSNRQMENPI